MNSERKIVYICSPCRGNREVNVGWARFYTKVLLKLGYTPITPHAFYSDYLNDEIPSDRTTALTVGLQLLRRCDEVWVFGQIVSPGMKREIIEAKNLDIPVRAVKVFCILGGRAAGKHIYTPYKLELSEV